MQEWLWCETWCGNSTKEAAKTIDLCNNPLTKEPKLQGARRIVAEWPGLDEEARNFTQQVGCTIAVTNGPWHSAGLLTFTHPANDAMATCCVLFVTVTTATMVQLLPKEHFCRASVVLSGWHMCCALCCLYCRLVVLSTDTI